MAQLKKPLTEMESALLELSSNEEIKISQAMQKAADDEYDRLSAIPLILNVIAKGYARKEGMDTKYMLRLSTSPEEKIAGYDLATCWLETYEHCMAGFVENEQEFKVECSELTIEGKVGNISEISEWINAQPSTNNWSLALRIPRRKYLQRKGTNILIFSFDNSHIAALFKMVYG